jgi:hypothetical protein
VSDPLSLVAAGTSGLAVLVAATAHVRFRRLRKACAVLQGGAEHSSLIVAASRQTAEMERLRAEVGRLRREFEQFQVAIDESIRRIAVLRYDAFGEAGGRLSWSVALLDDLGDTDRHRRTQVGQQVADVAPIETESVEQFRRRCRGLGHVDVHGQSRTSSIIAPNSSVT